MTSKPRKGGARRRSRPVLPMVLLGVVALAVVAGAVAWWSGSFGLGSEVQQTHPVEVKGAALPTLPDGASPQADPARGRPMPEIRGASFEGAPVVIANDGHPKMIVFLAHWCPHCQAEVPRLTAWLKRGGLPAGVEIWSVSTAVSARRSNYPPSRWLQQERWTVPVIADDRQGSAADAAGLSAFPFFVFVGADGKVSSRQAGELSLEQLEERLAAIARS